MEKAKKVETGVPEEIIQHIQSFLSAKEAGGTSILSKSWYSAWSTRPNLDLDENDFPMNLDPESECAFEKFAKECMQRHSELKRKIQSLSLWMRGDGRMWYERKNCVGKELIQKATKLGATDLVIGLIRRPCDRSYLVLPGEVFESECVARLSLRYCKIDRRDEVRLSGLKYLSLSRVYIELGNSRNLWDIISTCPLIEKLVLYECEYPYDYLVRYTRWLGLKPGLSFPKLKVLWLKKEETGEWIFRDFSSRFPCLEDLVLDNCRSLGYTDIQICSNSLQYISITHWMTPLLVTKFDVPKISKFKYAGRFVLMSFKTTSKEWESDICIYWFNMETLRLVELRQFLLELSPSKIYLDLGLTPPLLGYDYARDIIGSPKPPLVEKLTIRALQPSLSVEDLFWTCHPKFLVLFMGDTTSYDFAKLLYDTLIEEGDDNRRNISALRHLIKEVNIAFFREDDLAGCHPLPCITLLDTEAYRGTSLMNRIRVHFQFRYE